MQFPTSDVAGGLELYTTQISLRFTLSHWSIRSPDSHSQGANQKAVRACWVAVRYRSPG